MLAARVPCTELNEPPRNALPQPPLNAMLFTSPLTSGFQPDMVNGAVARKLNALFLVNVRPCHLTWLNRPTAYIREPHCTSCLTCSTSWVTGGKAGVPRAGRRAGTCPAGRCATGGRAPARAMARAGAGRVWAWAGAASPAGRARAASAAAAPARVLREVPGSLNCSAEDINRTGDTTCLSVPVTGRALRRRGRGPAGRAGNARPTLRTPRGPA